MKSLSVKTHRQTGQKHHRTFWSLGGVLVMSTAFWFSAPAFAEKLKVIELFTSQGCYSCPPADELMAELAAEDESILTLEFHVDYWDQLQYGSAGNWVDPYSSPDYTQRQRQYSAMKLRGENGVYTPQAVVNGVYGHVGSNRRAVNKGLDIKTAMPVNVSVERKDDTTLNVNVSGDENIDADVFLVQYLKKTETTITSGENHDKVMENHNVVTDMISLAKLADASKSPLQVSYAGGDNRGCAILVQARSQGAILGAARCP